MSKLFDVIMYYIPITQLLMIKTVKSNKIIPAINVVLYTYLWYAITRDFFNSLSGWIFWITVIWTVTYIVAIITEKIKIDATS